MYTEDYYDDYRMRNGERAAKIYFGLIRSLISISGPLNRHLKKRGIKIFYWVINTPAECDYAISKDCDGIMSDYPTKLKTYLDKRRQ